MISKLNKNLYFFAVLLAFISCVFQGFALSKSQENNIYIKSLWNITKMSNDILDISYGDHEKGYISNKVELIRAQLISLHEYLDGRPHTNPIMLLNNDLNDLALTEGKNLSTRINIIFQVHALESLLLFDIKNGGNVSSAYYMIAIATLWGTLIILLFLLFNPKYTSKISPTPSSAQNIQKHSLASLPKEKTTDTATNTDLSDFLINDDDDDDDEIDEQTLPGMKEIINEFIESIPTRRDKMKTSIQTKDYDTLKREVHTLKGLGGSIGFNELTEVAESIDALFKEDDIEVGISQIESLFSILTSIENDKK